MRCVLGDREFLEKHPYCRKKPKNETVNSVLNTYLFKDFISTALNESHMKL